MSWESNTNRPVPVGTGSFLRLTVIPIFVINYGPTTIRESQRALRRKYMPNVVHFEIGVDDLDGAVSFYSKVFDWKMEKSEDSSDYVYITTGDEDDPGISGGLTARFDEWNPTVNTIEVPSLDTCARKIAEAGGRVLAPKIPIPGMGYVQYCHDPEGNVFGIMEYDESSQ